jgi:hypothetical protein
MQQNPASCATLQRALREFLNPRTHVVIRFKADSEENWRKAVPENLTRMSDVYAITPDADDLPSIIAAQKFTSGGAAYVCRGVSCLPALTEPSALTDTLLSSWRS